MIRRAMFSPGPRSTFSHNILVALGMGAAVVLLGCGGGGGGGGNNNGGGSNDACQDNPAPGSAVICGYVLNEGTTIGVNGATVAVKSATGTVLRSIKTYRNSATGKDGYYVLQVPSNAALLGVAPPATGFFNSYFRFGSVYDINRTVPSGGPCNPALPALANQTAGNLLGSLYLFPDASTPPPPVFQCPRQ